MNHTMKNKRARNIETVDAKLIMYPSQQTSTASYSGIPPQAISLNQTARPSLELIKKILRMLQFNLRTLS